MNPTPSQSLCHAQKRRPPANFGGAKSGVRKTEALAVLSMRHTHRSLRSVTHARTSIPYATEAITRRTTMRKAALGAWDPRVQQGWLYNLASAANALDIDVHFSTLVLNHHHTSVTAKHGNISAFLQRLHQPMSCFVNTLLQQRGFTKSLRALRTDCLVNPMASQGPSM